MVKSMYRLLHVDSGFDPDGVLTMQINLPPQKYVDEKLERQSLTAGLYAIGRLLRGHDRSSTDGARRRQVAAINGLPLMGEIWGKFLTLYDRPLPSDFRDLSIDSIPRRRWRLLPRDGHSHRQRPCVYGRGYGAGTEGGDRESPARSPRLEGPGSAGKGYFRQPTAGGPAEVDD